MAQVATSEVIKGKPIDIIPQELCFSPYWRSGTTLTKVTEHIRTITGLGWIVLKYFLQEHSNRYIPRSRELPGVCGPLVSDARNTHLLSHS